MASTPTTAPGRKSLEIYTGLGRSPVESQVRLATVNPSAAIARPPLHDFDNSNIFPWIANWLKTVGTTRHAFEAYPAEGDRGLYDLSGLLSADGSIRIAIAGDWGTGTDVAQQVADSMVSNNPEFTIHLGDVYYVGTDKEIQENCLGVNGAYQGVFWRRGSKGSFALNGNHEMYSGGSPYFNVFLPTLGIPTSQDKQQLRSYFCLEASAWRIVAIDTGYNSDTIGGDCTLEQPLLDWLQSVVDPIHNPKPTVLLSHHQWFSGFGDGDYPKPAQQIAPFFKNQQIVWLWGHEHRLAIFYPYKSPRSQLLCYARCIGHGGMPLEVASSAYPNEERTQRVEYWDNPDLHPDRFHKLSDGTLVGTNGYAMMTIQSSKLTLEYLDADGTSVLKESFVAGGGSTWDGTLSRTVESDPQILNRMIYE
jgi:hypothetical protein